MRRFLLMVCILLLGAGIVLAIPLLSGVSIPLKGSQPAEPLQPAPSVQSSTSLTPAPTPSPTLTPVRTTVPAPAPAEITPLPPVSPITIPGDPYTISTTGLGQRIHELINGQRTIHGLAPLSLDPALSDIAWDHSNDMADRNYFAHVDPDGKNPTDRANDAGYTCRKVYASYYTYGIAENLFQNNLYSSATYYSNRKTEYDWNSPEEIAQTTVGGWMNSTGHRENILTPSFDREGIGVAIAPDSKVYITEDFC